LFLCIADSAVATEMGWTRLHAIRRRISVTSITNMP